MKTKILFTSLICAEMLTTAIRAEEGGSGHYLSGGTASFVDAFPGKPGAFAVANVFTYYDASASANRSLELGGLITANVNATAYAETIVLAYQTPWSVLGGGWGMSVVVPYLWMEVSGTVTLPGGGTAAQRDTANGFGDITLVPFMLGWTNILPDLKVDARLSVYVPTGGYDVGQLANLGKNYWTFEPGFMASWLSSKLGTEISLYAGVDFNTKNHDTDYQTGTAFHVDGTIAQHLPLLGGIAGVGANAFYYQQICGDSGSGAALGGFEGRTAGIGPALSYVTKVGKANLIAEVKWLPELDVEKRLKGDYIWFKLALAF